MPSMMYLMLSSARRARLEARTGLLQLSFLSAARFPDSLESGNPGAQGLMDPGSSLHYGRDDDSYECAGLFPHPPAKTFGERPAASERSSARQSELAIG